MAKTFPRFSVCKNPILFFYLDRLFRLYPAFLVCFLISYFYYNFVGHNLHQTNLIGELLLIPQNYHFVSTNLTNHMIDPAWSLGAEFQWYLLVPLITFLSNFVKWVLLVTLLSGQILVFSLDLLGISNDSCSFFPSAFFDTCFPLSDLLGYRLLIFASAAFLLGHITSEMKWGRQRFIFSLSSGFFLLWVLYSWHEITLQRFNDVMFAYVVMLPLILFSISEKIRKWEFYKVDRVFSGLSYPVFLTHFLAIDIANRYFHSIFDLSGLTLEFLKMSLAGCLTLGFSALLFYIQNNIDLYRIKYRGFNSLQNSNPY